MSDMPERIFIAETLAGMIAIAGEPPAWVTSPSYRRADLPPTLAEALAVPEVKALVSALEAVIGAVCGDTGFAACVRADTGLAYPWPALDEAEERARSALRALETPQ